MNPIENFLKNKHPVTQKNYRWVLNQFFKELKADPDTYFTQGRNYKEDIESWWAVNVNSVPKTRNTKLGIIKGFFEEREEVSLPPKFFKNLRKMRKGNRASTLDRVPSKAELKNILTHGNCKDRALFTFAVSSGMRIGEILKITPLMLDLNHDPPMVKIPATISKTGDPRITFISYEAKSYLAEWLKIKDAYIKKACSKSSHICKKNPIDDRVFPFSYDIAWTRWNHLVRKAGLQERDLTTNNFTLHIHVLRKYFLSQLKLSIPEVIAEALAGHEEGLDEAYSRYAEKELGDYYKKGMEKVMVFEGADIEKTNEELEVLKKGIEQLTKEKEEMKAQIMELRLEKLEKINGIKKNK